MSEHASHHAALRAKTSSRLLVGVLVTAVALGTLAGVAFAFWQTTDSSNPAAASATSLSAPTGVTTTETGKTSVKVSWANSAARSPERNTNSSRTARPSAPRRPTRET